MPYTTTTLKADVKQKNQSIKKLIVNHYKQNFLKKWLSNWDLKFETTKILKNHFDNL